MPNVYVFPRGTTDDRVVLGMFGPLSGHTSAQLRAALVNKPGRTIALDLSGCTGLDLDGAFALDTLAEQLRGNGGRLQLVNVPPLISHYLRDHTMGHLLES